MSGNRYAFTRVRLPGQADPSCRYSVLVCEDKVVSVSRESPPMGMGYREIDGGGCWLTPGFIDLHVHGGNGFDFMDGTVEAFLGAAEFHARFGTTTLLPTLCAARFTDYRKIGKAYRKAREEARVQGMCCMPGLYLEGPYINPEYRGAQEEKKIRKPVPREYQALLKAMAEDIRIWGAAPEIAGTRAWAACVKSHGIVASIAHSAAWYEEAAVALENDYSHLTHFYNAMSGARKIGALRRGGVVEAGYLNDRATIELIADGIHVSACLLKLAYRIKGSGRICLVTDAIRAAGLPDQSTAVIGDKENGTRIIVDQGVSWLADRSALAGSIATTDMLLRQMVQKAGVPLEEAVRMLTATPAGVAGLRLTKGQVKARRDADLVLLDKNLRVRMTMIRGMIRHDTLS